MGNNTAHQQQDLEKKHIEAVLFGLMKELQKLAPHPHTPDDHDTQPAQTYKIGHKKSISATFNTNGLHAEMMGAYLRDLPRRLGLERFVSDYNRKLYAERKHAALGLAA